MLIPFSFVMSLSFLRKGFWVSILSLGVIASHLCLAVFLDQQTHHWCREYIGLDQIQAKTKVSRNQRIKISQEEIEQAKNAIKQKDYLKAIDHVESAYRAFPSVSYLYLMSRLYDRLPDQCSLALKSWERADLKCSNTCSLKDKIQKRQRQTQNECLGILQLHLQPADTEVYLNRQRVKLSPGRILRVQAQEYDLRLVHKQKEINTRLSLPRGFKKMHKHFNLSTFRGRHDQKTSKHISKHNPSVALESQERKSGGSNLSNSKSFKTAENQPETRSNTPTVQDKQIQNTLKLFGSEYLKKHVLLADHERSLSPNDDPFAMKEDAPWPAQNRKVWQWVQGGDLSLKARIECQYLSRFGQYQYLEVCNGLPLKPKDRVRFEIEVNQEVYLYLFVTDHKQNWQLVFPVLGESNRVSQTEAFYILGKEWLILDESKNTIDDFSIIVSKEPLPLLEKSRMKPQSGPIPSEYLPYMMPIVESREELVAHLKKNKKQSSLFKAQDLGKNSKHLSVHFQIFKR